MIRLQALQPKASHRALATQFNRLYAAPRSMTVSSSYVHYTVRTNRLAIARLRLTIKARAPAELPANAVWAVDMSGKVDKAGRLHMMLGVLDRGSRKALALSAPPNKASWTLLGHLFLVIGRHGKQGALRSDNERVFTSRVFGRALRLADIHHQRIDAGCPW